MEQHIQKEPTIRNDNMVDTSGWKSLGDRYLLESGWELFNCPNCDMGYWHKAEIEDYAFWHALVCSGRNRHYQVVDDVFLVPPPQEDE